MYTHDSAAKKTGNPTMSLLKGWMESSNAGHDQHCFSADKMTPQPHLPIDILLYYYVYIVFIRICVMCVIERIQYVTYTYTYAYHQYHQIQNVSTFV